MYVLPVAELLALDALLSFEDIRDKLVEYHEDLGSCAFISHTWLRSQSPDSVAGSDGAGPSRYHFSSTLLAHRAQLFFPPLQKEDNDMEN